nr:RepA-like protein [Citrus chlorotic dwarf associated virus]
MASTSSSFRFSAKNIFLTYPKCPCTKEHLQAFLRLILARFTITYMCVCEELHESGDPHLHAMIQCKKRVETQNPRFFDLLSVRRERSFHPCIESLKSPAASRKYLMKDGNYVEEGRFNSRARSPQKDQEKLWRDVLLEATDERSFLNLVRELRPSDFVLRWPAISAFARDNYCRLREPFIPAFTEFPNLPEHVKQWAQQNILCVSKPFLQYELCYSCCPKAIFETECPINLQHHFWCDEHRNQTPSPTGPNPSTSAAQADQAKPPGPEV